MIHIKTPQELEIMAQGGKILAGIMKELERQIKPGKKTSELDRLAESLVLKSGGQCSFKGYDGSAGEHVEPFPACLCVSLNSTVVHGASPEAKLESGDMVSLDIGMFYKGFHTDMARSFAVGRISPLAKKLLKVTKQALEIAKETARPGVKLKQVSLAIQKYVEANGFNVVRQLCGHGIGRELHEEPQILNFVGNDYGGDEGVILKPGMVFCLEPMVTVGDWNLRKAKDGFGYETKDGSLSCHFEDTVALTGKGLEILTRI